MQRGLDGRRVAVFAGSEGDALKIALEGAGALVELLSDGRSRSDEAWHAGRYAAVVVGSGRDDGLESRVVQMIREFLLSGKPVVVMGEGVAFLQEAGGSSEDALQVDGVRPENASAVVRLLAERLEDVQVDEMSELSFPASDPPATTPASIGPKRSGDVEAR